MDNQMTSTSETKGQLPYPADLSYLLLSALGLWMRTTKLEAWGFTWGRGSHLILVQQNSDIQYQTSLLTGR